MAKAKKEKAVLVHLRAPGVNLGRLQETFEQANRDWKLAERVLARAQEARDGAKSRALAADQALQEAVRVIRG